MSRPVRERYWFRAALMLFLLAAVAAGCIFAGAVSLGSASR